MIDALKLSQVRDLSAERLPDLWWRRRPTQGAGRETMGSGVWRTGTNGEFRRALVDAIDGAQQVVLVASFLLADATLADAMLKAAGRGVRVYALTASEQRVAKAPDDDEVFEKRMVDEHKQLLRSLTGKTLLRSAEHFHAKFVVVDPPWVGAGRTRAFLSTANFNKALTDSVELGIELDPAQAGALAGAFVQAFWSEAERELVEADRLASVGKPPALPVVPSHAGVLTTTKTSTGLREGVLALIASAKRQLVVSCYGLDAAHPSVIAIRDAAARGVAVTVLTRPRPAVVAATRLLAEAGAVVRAHEKLHAKAIIADGVGLVMTANLEAHGLDRGFEVGVRVDPFSKVLAVVLSEWEEGFPWEFRLGPQRKDAIGEVWMGDKGSRDPKVEVVDLETVALPPVIAADALALDNAPGPDLKAPATAQRVSCRVRFDWEVRPPTLPKDAKERLRTVKRDAADKEGKPTVVEDRVAYEPPVFEHKGAVFVKLRSRGDIDAARRLAVEMKGVVVV